MILVPWTFTEHLVQVWHLTDLLLVWGTQRQRQSWEAIPGWASTHFGFQNMQISKYKKHLTGAIKWCYYLVMVLFRRLNIWYNDAILTKMTYVILEEAKGISYELSFSLVSYTPPSPLIVHSHLWTWRPSRHPLPLSLNCRMLKIYDSVKVYFKAFTYFPGEK